LLLYSTHATIAEQDVCIGIAELTIVFQGHLTSKNSERQKSDNVQCPMLDGFVPGIIPRTLAVIKIVPVADPRFFFGICFDESFGEY
jgi:hypothetical protein